MAFAVLCSLPPSLVVQAPSGRSFSMKKRPGGCNAASRGEVERGSVKSRRPFRCVSKSSALARLLNRHVQCGEADIPGSVVDPLHGRYDHDTRIGFATHDDFGYASFVDDRFDMRNGHHTDDLAGGPRNANLFPTPGERSFEPVDIA